MSSTHTLIDRIIKLQDKVLVHMSREDLKEGEGNVAQLNILGLQGEALKLKFDNGRVVYAETNEQPLHIITLSEDTMLDILDGSADLSSEFNLGHITFHNAPGVSGDWLYHMTKWRDGFTRMRSTLKYIMSGIGGN